MALQIDPRMYSGGAVALDSQPSVNMYAQLMARKQAETKAKDEAVTKYFHDVIKELNPAGIRDIHLGGVKGKPPGIIDDINDWKQESIANISEISKGGRAKMDSDTKVNAILQRIQSAKNRDKFLLELGKAQFEGTYNAEEDDLKIIDRVSRSIYDKTSYKEDGVSDFGWGDLPSKQTPIDESKKFGEWSKGFTKTEKIGDVLRKEPVTGRAIVAMTKSFDTEMENQMGENASNDVKNDRKLYRHYDKKLKGISEEDYDKFNKIFQSAYGETEERIMSNGKRTRVSNYIFDAADLAAAETIAQARAMTEKGEKAVLDKELAFKQSLEKISRNQRGKGNEETTPPPRDGENYDLTERFQGLKVSTLVNTPYGVAVGSKILYNPQTDQISYTDFQGNAKTKSFIQFKKDISTINTVQDLKIIDEVMNSIGTPRSKRMNQPTSEYSQITETNTGKLGVKNGKWYYIETGKPYEQ